MKINRDGDVRHNEEQNELLDGPDVVNCIKFERLQWAGHVVQTDSTRIPKRVLSGIFYGRRPVGRPCLI